MLKSICLIGNPNCGKTSLFNELTGLSQKVGNWSGVTTEKKEGTLLSDRTVKVIDLPGIYTLSAHSKDEQSVIDYLSTNKPSVIINVLDGTNLERNLYLTTELIKLNIPLVIAVNFCDELQYNGVKINHEFIQKAFGVKSIEISAKKKINITRLIEFSNGARIPDKRCYLLQEINKGKEREYISQNIKKIVNKQDFKRQKLTEKLDNIILHKVWAIPLFALIIFCIYFISSSLGGKISDEFSILLDKFTINTQISMQKAGFSEWSISLFTQAVLKGVGSVLAFTPQILLLFFFITLIEESGYATRISFIFDRIFRGFGLGGKSVIPIALSCGCAVSGIMATRTIENEGERKMTVCLAPFMPCGAKTIVFGWFSYAFFDGNPLIATSMYFLGVLCVGTFGLLIKRLKIFTKEDNLFLLEMPLLRFPSIKNIFRVLWEKFKDFTYRSGTVIFLVSIVLWLLSNFGIKGYTNDVTQSFLYFLGNVLKFVFYPLGFGNWQATISIITGLFAKEAVIETLEVIAPNLEVIFADKFSVYAFMAFILLSPPCLASIICAKNELQNNRHFTFMLLFQFFAGYSVALVIVLLGKLVTFVNGLIFIALLGIIILLLLIRIVTKTIKNKTQKRAKIL